jgi:hypothetical protein
MTDIDGVAAACPVSARRGDIDVFLYAHIVVEFDADFIPAFLFHYLATLRIEPQRMLLFVHSLHAAPTPTTPPTTTSTTATATTTTTSTTTTSTTTTSTSMKTTKAGASVPIDTLLSRDGGGDKGKAVTHLPSTSSVSRQRLVSHDALRRTLAAVSTRKQKRRPLPLRRALLVQVSSFCSFLTLPSILTPKQRFFFSFFLQ